MLKYSGNTSIFVAQIKIQTIMTYEALLIEMHEGTAIITINRPSALNAINKQVMSELNHFFSEGHTAYEGLHAAIITGSGEKAFAAGADIKEFSSLNQEEAQALSKYGQDTYFHIENFHLPVIAVVNGFALGGGCELAMACHMRIASSNAKFGQPEVNLGLLPGYGGTQRLPQLIGKARALELLFTADMISAERATELGLANYTEGTKEEAMDRALSMIKKISSKGPLAIAKTINAVNACYDETLNGYVVEHKDFGACIVSDDAREGAQAFVEKRKAKFTGK